MNEPRKPNNLFDARAILLTIIKLGVKNPSPLPTMGCGVDHLISTAVLYPGDIDRICDMMMDQDCEFRINGSGLKLVAGRHTGLAIRGDQTAYYPDFVQKANAYLQERGLQRTGE